MIKKIFSFSLLKLEERIKVLEGINLFANLTYYELKKIARLGLYEKFPKDIEICKEGDEGTAMYIILDGAVKVIKELPDNTEKELAVLSKGNFFGEMALFMDSPKRNATIKTIVETKLLAIYKHDFLQLVNTHTVIGVKILKNIATELCNRISKTNEKIKDMQMQIQLF